MSVLFILAVVAFVAVGLLLGLVVLVQRGRGAGLILGGAGGNSLLGPNTAPALTWLTAGLFALFLALAVTLNLMAG